MCWFGKLFTGTIERPSPQDWVSEDAITQDGKKLIIDLNKNFPFPIKTWIPYIPDTNSMEPCFDAGNNNILIAGVSSNDHATLVAKLKVGDIAVYDNIIHRINRIVEMKTDVDGIYYKFKGDNNSYTDLEKVRPSEITWISLGTIY